jgi:outer membrane protein assembly factor BamB
MRYALLVGIFFSAALLAQSSTTANADALLEAARTGDRARVVALLDSGVSVNAQSRYGVNAVGFAADRGHFEIVRLLVERGADVNVADSFYGSRPIDFALRGGHLDIALYLIERGSQGAVSVLNAGIRRKDISLVKAALATGQADGMALASAKALAAQSGDAAIAALVEAAAAEKPAVLPPVISVSGTLLRSYEGKYQNATTGAAVIVTFDGRSLTMTADGQSALQLQPIEARRFRAENAPEVTVTFAGRGGIIERLSVARGSASVRYEREGFGDATSPAPAPETVAPRAASGTASARSADPAPRGKPLPWPAFRGANASGAADGQGAVSEWDVTTGKNIKWKTAIPGLATSSPIVWGDRIIVLAAASDSDKSFRTGLYGDVKPVDESLSRHSFRVYALDRASGRVIWDKEAFSGPPLTKRHTKSSQANSTPVTDGRHIVAVFGAIGLMVCYDMDGALLWKKDIGVIDSGWFLDPSYQWGHSSSPVIYKSSVIVQADQAKGSYIAAFDLASGRELWRTSRDEISTWATPTVLSGPKGDELVTNGTKVRGYDPATGALLWTLAPNSEVVIGTPVVYRDMAIITAGYPPVRPVYAVRAGARGDISLPPGQSKSAAIAWSHDRDGTYISTPIVYRDQLYTLNNNGILTAYAAETGERLYRARVGGGGAFSASPIAADGKLYLASEDGDVFVIQAGREYVELAKNPMAEIMMASPAISNGLVIIRTLGHVWGIGR